MLMTTFIAKMTTREKLAKYGRGLVGAAINSVTTSLTVLIAEPAHFNLTSVGGFQRIGSVALIAAFVGALLYVKTHPPIPEE